MLSGVAAEGLGVPSPSLAAGKRPPVLSLPSLGPKSSEAGSQLLWGQTWSCVRDCSGIAGGTHDQAGGHPDFSPGAAEFGKAAVRGPEATSSEDVFIRLWERA